MTLGSSSESEFSELEGAGVEPITLDDIYFQPSYAVETFGQDDQIFDPTEGGRFFSIAMSALARKKKKSSKVLSAPKRRWLRAVKLIKDRGDPWEKFHLDKIKTQRARRHRYNPLTKAWVVDDCVIKLDRDPFAHGAMRECFRMKKLSDFSHCNDWTKDSNNFVAKRYMDKDIPRETYFDDVKLQMDAKLWGEEYNRHNPPKKVDIFMMGVIELVEISGAPLYHIEHYIDGEYVKYNSNSGFVKVLTGFMRQTPQAFSHFTFERSGHELMVVDIQGVGDLYTDPQIHTAAGLEYGDGNLGTKGMALFFHTHQCNSICHNLGLTAFDLSKNETNQLKSATHQVDIVTDKMTRVKMDEMVCCESPSLIERADFGRLFRNRSGSSGFIDYNPANIERNISHLSTSSHDDLDHLSESEHGIVFTIDYAEDSRSSTERSEDSRSSTERSEDSRSSTESSEVSRSSTERSEDSGVGVRQQRKRGMTECFEGTEEKEKLQERLDKKSRTSCVLGEMARKLSGLVHHHSDSVLGQIHLDLAQYHETCRFDANIQDKSSAHFHLKAAADCDNKQALTAISCLYLGLPNDILPALTQLDAAEYVAGNIEDIGLDYMVSAARYGDVSSMVFLAKAFDSGLNLGKDRSQSYSQAVDWYQKAVNNGAEKRYLLMARMAEIMMMEDSGCQDPGGAAELYSQAAEAAMEEMCGKLATKYYMLAEEAWAAVDE